MAKIKISKKEIETMLKDQLNCETVRWDTQGNATVELDLAEIKKKASVVEKEHHHYHDRWTYPIYIKEPIPMPYPIWNITCSSTSTSSGTLRYCNTGGTTQ